MSNENEDCNDSDMIRCPFCGLDPYEYVDTGIVSIPFAVNCCKYGYLLFAKNIPIDDIKREIAEREKVRMERGQPDDIDIGNDGKIPF
jgi:hypothetical protein